jgi:hypothetical protein
MKVLDLQCALGHDFEGWFASEDDFQTQLQQFMVECPLCGDHAVVKKLSAPRLSLASHRADHGVQQDTQGPVPVEQALATAWMAMARKLIAETTDVGHRFAEEARKMHYGEVEERNIRGQTSTEEAKALLEEGIDVLPLILPQALKGPLQ